MPLSKISDIIFEPEGVPSAIGGDMRIWHEDISGTRYYYVDRGYRRPDGTATHYKRKTTDPKEHAKHVIEAQSITGEVSITSERFDACVKIYLEERGTGGFSQACYNRASAALGRMYPDKPSFSLAYAKYCQKLEASGGAINTINNHKIVVRSICNYAYKTSRCGSPAVRDYSLKHGNERNRILNPAEQLKIENKLREWDSHLIWAFDFALKNPIRKSDLFALRREDLKCEIFNGKQIYYVQMQAKKTRRTAKGKITTLPNISPEMVKYVESLPHDCPYLFPMIGTTKNGMHTKMKPGTWKKIIDADRHFGHVLTEAGVHDFHFHDLKHCAETYMLRQGYTYDAMRKLGIQMSPKTQKIYDNRSQVEIVALAQIPVASTPNCSTFVASKNGTN